MKDFSIISGLIYDKYVNKWLEEIEYAEVLDKRVKEVREELKANLDEKKVEILKKYEHAIESMTFDKDIQMSAKILNMGMKIGFELGKIFSDIDNKDC